MITREKMFANLAAVPATDPALTAILFVLSEMLEEERVDAVRPDLSNEARQYNAGRAASLYDFKAVIEAARQ